MSDEHTKLRLQVAEAHGFALYKTYTMQQFAGFIGKEISFVKRHKAAGNLMYIEDVGGGIRFLGIYIADYIILGKKANEVWQDTSPETQNTPAGNGGLDNATALPHGTASDTTQPNDKTSRFHSALRMLRKPKES